MKAPWMYTTEVVDLNYPFMIRAATSRAKFVSPGILVHEQQHCAGITGWVLNQRRGEVMLIVLRNAWVLITLHRPTTHTQPRSLRLP